MHENGVVDGEGLVIMIEIWCGAWFRENAAAVVDGCERYAAARQLAPGYTFHCACEKQPGARRNEIDSVQSGVRTGKAART